MASCGIMNTSAPVPASPSSINLPTDSVDDTTSVSTTVPGYFASNPSFTATASCSLSTHNFKLAEPFAISSSNSYICCSSFHARPPSSFCASASVSAFCVSPDAALSLDCSSLPHPASIPTLIQVAKNNATILLFIVFPP